MRMVSRENGLVAEEEKKFHTSGSYEYRDEDDYLELIMLLLESTHLLEKKLGSLLLKSLTHCASVLSSKPKKLKNEVNIP